MGRFGSAHLPASQQGSDFTFILQLLPALFPRMPDTKSLRIPVSTGSTC